MNNGQTFNREATNYAKLNTGDICLWQKAGKMQNKTLATYFYHPIQLISQKGKGQFRTQ